MPSGAEPSWTLIYDGECGVCGKLADALRRRDRRAVLEILPSSSPGLAGRFPWVTPADYAAAMQLVGPDRATWSGADAVEQLLRLLPAGWLGSWVFRLPGGRAAARAGYRWFARHRVRLGCALHGRPTAGAPPARRPDTSP